MRIRLSHPTKKVAGRIVLEGSKSISNRILVIKHLSKGTSHVTNLSKSDDTKYLSNVLDNIQEVNNVHHAGTAFRFLTGILSFTEGTQILTGSDRMKERPIGPLVDALRSIGADIEYEDQEGFPPLRIGSPIPNENNEIIISGGVSSQFLSSLALIAPTRPHGLSIQIEGDIVSKPYLDMTLDLMKKCGVEHIWREKQLIIPQGQYHMGDYYVESDWSSASYLFSIASIADECDIKIEGLFENSIQPDSIIKELSSHFGVHAQFKNDLLIVRKSEKSVVPFLEYNFLNSPDIAQTVFVMCAAQGVNALFGGLETLKIKETDRILACSTELAKINVFLHPVPQRFASRSNLSLFMMEGKAQWEEATFATYNDHRMAMSFAPLALIDPIEILDAEVVSKSYPGFWDDLSELGFNVHVMPSK